MLGPVGNTIKDKLASAFRPVRLEVMDESHHHAGHAGARPDGESHFRVAIVADAFRGKSRVEQHRMVNAALADLLASRVHALAIQSSAPPELTFTDLDANDPRLLDLLTLEKLATADLPGDGKHYVGISDASGRILAAGGIELCGSAALLRSVAVQPGRRGERLGHTITLKLLSMARNAGVRDVYLLTVSAGPFFEKFGFEAIDRADAPTAIASTSQFMGSACRTARPMRVRLQAQTAV